MEASASVMELMNIVRRLVRTPFISAIAVFTLALGIAGNTAVFTVVDAVLVNPLPYEDPDRLVALRYRARGIGLDEVFQSWAIHLSCRARGRAFTDVGLWTDDLVAVTGEGDPEQASAVLVSDGTLALLGARPAHGRLFAKGDGSASGAPTAILGHGYWQRRFGANPAVVGTFLTVDGETTEIVGVLPAGFRFMDREPELYLAFQVDPEEVVFGNFSYRAVGRLKPGVSLAEADQDLARVVRIALQSYPMLPGYSMKMFEDAHLEPAIQPLADEIVGDVDTLLWVLLGTVGMVLLVACANVANLFLVRAEGRRQELAIRSALGASRAQLGGSMLAESVLLGVGGGIVGLGLAWLGLRLLVVLGPTALPRLGEIAIDGRVIFFNSAVSVVAGLLFGVVPVLRLKTSIRSEALKEEGRSGTVGRGRRSFRSALVVLQIALALVLLVGSGLMIRTLLALRSVEPGFARPDDVLTFRLTIPEAEIPDGLLAADTHERILRALGAVPGVGSVGASSSVTMDGVISADSVFVEDHPSTGDVMSPIRRFKYVFPGYLETMGNPLVAGRTPSWQDLHQRERAVVVTENLAREYWSEPVAAVGKRLRATPEDPWWTIVGVVGDVRDDGVDRPPTATVYWPAVMEGFWANEFFAPRSFAYVIRSSRAGSGALIEEVQDAVWSVNRNLPLAQVRTLRSILDGATTRTSFALVMLSIAALVALVLGSVGTYGVVSYTVMMRNREIGLRMAIGADRRDVMRMVLRQAFVLVGSGILVGVAAAAVLTRLMDSLLFGVGTADPVTFGLVIMALAGVALGASYLPARRAASVDPIEVLR